VEGQYSCEILRDWDKDLKEKKCRIEAHLDILHRHNGDIIIT
jgi:hypothetical protein